MNSHFLLMFNMCYVFSVFPITLLIYFPCIMEPPDRPTSPIRKNKRGKIVTYPQKLLIINLYKSIVSDPLLNESYRSVILRISKLTGIGRCSVYKIVDEFTFTGNVTPTIRKRKTWAFNPDAFEAAAIRQKVHQFFKRNEAPTIRKLLKAINDDETLRNYSRTKVHEILRKMDFRFVKRNRKSILLERDDLIQWRQKYLRLIHQYRQEG